MTKRQVMIRRRRKWTSWLELKPRYGIDWCRWWGPQHGCHTPGESWRGNTLLEVVGWCQRMLKTARFQVGHHRPIYRTEQNRIVGRTQRATVIDFVHDDSLPMIIYMLCLFTFLFAAKVIFNIYFKYEYYEWMNTLNYYVQ